MVKIIYLSWNLDLKILYMSWNFCRKFFYVLFQNPMLREHVEIYILKLIKILIIRHRGVFDKVPAFEPGSPGSIPGGVRNFNFCPGIGYVSFVCVLSYVVSSRGPDIVLSTHSGRPALYICLVFWFKDCCSPYTHLTNGHFCCKPRAM